MQTGSCMIMNFPSDVTVAKDLTSSGIFIIVTACCKIHLRVWFITY